MYMYIYDTDAIPIDRATVAYTDLGDKVCDLDTLHYSTLKSFSCVKINLQLLQQAANSITAL